jgi:hypothetical protein
VRQSKTTPVVLCIDVEPDARMFDPAEPPPWIGFERFVERAPDLRHRLAELSGAPVQFTWCLRMDQQVARSWGSAEWVAGAYRPLLDELVGQGDELGLHTHNWRWDGEGWYAEFDDAAYAAETIDGAADAFERAFGRACEVHRAGDHYLSGAMLERLEARGVCVDLSIEPGQRSGGAVRGEASRGTSPDYRNVPTGPYRSSAGAFPGPDPDGTGPLLIPLTSALGSRRLTRTHIPPDSSPKSFIPRLEIEMLRPSSPPVLAFAARSDAALTRWEALVRNITLIARRHEVRFVTATGALALLGEQHVPPLPAASPVR